MLQFIPTLLQLSSGARNMQLPLYAYRQAALPLYTCIAPGHHQDSAFPPHGAGIFLHFVFPTPEVPTISFICVMPFELTSQNHIDPSTTTLPSYLMDRWGPAITSLKFPWVNNKDSILPHNHIYCPLCFVRLPRLRASCGETAVRPGPSSEIQICTKTQITKVNAGGTPGCRHNAWG